MVSGWRHASDKQGSLHIIASPYRRGEVDTAGSPADLTVGIVKHLVPVFSKTARRSFDEVTWWTDMSPSSDFLKNIQKTLKGYRRDISGSVAAPQGLILFVAGPSIVATHGEHSSSTERQQAQKTLTMLSPEINLKGGNSYFGSRRRHAIGSSQWEPFDLLPEADPHATGPITVIIDTNTPDRDTDIQEHLEEMNTCDATIITCFSPIHTARTMPLMKIALEVVRDLQHPLPPDRFVGVLLAEARRTAPQLDIKVRNLGNRCGTEEPSQERQTPIPANIS